MKNVVLGALLAAVALFVWGFVFWAVGNPISTMSGNSDAVRDVLIENIGENGVYIIPDTGQGTEAFNRKHEEGPLVSIYFRRAGAPPMSVSVFILGFVHMFVTALLAGLLLKSVVPALQSFMGRVKFVVLVGLIATFWVHASNPIWFNQPWGFNLIVMLYDIVAFLIAGLILARFVKPQEVAIAV